MAAHKLSTLMAVATGPVGPVLTGPLFRRKVMNIQKQPRTSLLVCANAVSLLRRCEICVLKLALIAANESLPTLSDEPYHHKAGYSFSKRSFGKSKPVLCSAQNHWFRSWPFLYYDEGQDVVLCHMNYQR